MARDRQPERTPANVFARLAAVQTSAPPASSASGSATEISRHLEALAKCGEEALPRQTLVWLAHAASEYLAAQGGSRSMDECLGLKPRPSQRSWRTIASQEERDRWIVAAFEALKSGAPDGTDYRFYQDLGAEIGVFEEAHWPAWQDHENPPSDATPLRAALFRAFKAGDGHLPQTWRSLREVVQRAKGAA